MKKQLCKCRGKKPDGSGYTDCEKQFILDSSECCPACGGSDYREIDQVEIPEITQAHKILEHVMTLMNTHCDDGELDEERVGVMAAIRILES